MVWNVPRSMLQEHTAMYWFDLRQQFGVAIVPLALTGLAHLTWTHWRRSLLIVLSFAVNFAFAYSYNVGDKHVFYLPSHLFVAVLAGCGAAGAIRLAARGESPASHRGRRGAPLIHPTAHSPRRVDPGGASRRPQSGAPTVRPVHGGVQYREYSSEEQRSQRGCIAG